MVILAVDTSTPTGSIAVVSYENSNKGTVLAEHSITTSVTHNRRLLVNINAILKELEMSIKNIDGFAVGTGPGSFTGLRIGVTTIKTLAWVLKKPLKGISSLDVLVRQFLFFRGLICPIIDARKREVYWALYEGDGSKYLKKVIDYSVSPPAEVAKRLKHIKEKILFCGDGWIAYGAVLQSLFFGKIYEPLAECHMIRASLLASAAFDGFTKGISDDPTTLVPCYVRPSEAELLNPHIQIP